MAIKFEGFSMKRLILIGFLILSKTAYAETFEKAFVTAAHERTTHKVRYDGRYISIKYPNGDVPPNIGVCTDVIIRAYRALGADLQKLVHEDMINNFSLYPSKKIWGLSKTDRNIDHRRVPNLQTFFSRFGQSKNISKTSSDYYPGDLVTWVLPGNLPHIGIIAGQFDLDSGNPLVIHNIGRGPELSDILFSYPITGHYKYVPDKFMPDKNKRQSNQ
jgi:uncharacterized protein